MSELKAVGDFLDGKVSAARQQKTRQESHLFPQTRLLIYVLFDIYIKLRSESREASKESEIVPSRPPINAEYVLYLFLEKVERDDVIGDLIEGYSHVSSRFGSRRADLWFYKQVAGSLWPLFRRAVFKLGVFVWLGRILRRLIS